MIRLGRAIVAALVFGLWPVVVLAGECRTDVVQMKGDWGQARFSVELADTARERSRGLMHRETMPRMSGMLFVYPFPQRVAFWMRNTLIPLDMVFMDRTGTVTRVHHNAIPLDETPIPGGDNIKFVLEVNGGMAQRLGLDVGTVMRHPTVPQRTAAWPCG